jgi:hypothetical protein
MSEERNTEEMLSGLLSMLGDNPQETIALALSKLTGGGASDGGAADAPETEAKENAASEEAAADFDPSGLSALGGLEGLNVSALLKVARLYQEAGRDTGDKARLLSALRPFLSEGRRSKVDAALAALKLGALAQKAKESGILKEFKL